MTSSLIPEKPLLVSPSLAATIGLEEATMLNILHEFIIYRNPTLNNGYEWLTLESEALQHAMPFWTEQDMLRISKSLRDKGIILIASAPFGASNTFKFALNEKIERAPGAAPSTSTTTPTTPTTPTKIQTQTRHYSRPLTPSFNKNLHVADINHNEQRHNEQNHNKQNHNEQNHNGQNHIEQIKEQIKSKQDFADQNYSRAASIIPPNWQPSEDILQRLAIMHNIPKSFSLKQVPGFVTYWTDRREAHFSWGSKFFTCVKHNWRNHETEMASISSNQAISDRWFPSIEAMDILLNQDIPRDFIEDAIPEFVLYWKERGDSNKTWNTLFIKHIKLQWARFTKTLEHDNQPSTIAANWTPSNDVYDVLRLANIDVAFAQSLIKEFVIFWRDANEISRSWNTKFLQHIKYHWAKRHNLATGHVTQSTAQSGQTNLAAGNYYDNKQQGFNRTGPGHTSKTFERLIDRSWAEGL